MLAAKALELQARSREPLCAFVYDLAALRKHASGLVATLPSSARLFYAIKANSEEPILRALAPIVHGFEVASLGEICKVRAIAPDAPILFGGPAKTDAEMEGALFHNVQWFHVESLHEGLRLDDIAARLGCKVSILLRVNLRGPLPVATLQMSGVPTQFGIDEDQLPAVAERLKACEHLEILGFHLHCLSNQLDAQIHVELVRSYCQKARAWSQQLGIELRYLNCGGGIGVNYQQLDQQFDWPTFVAGLAAIGHLPFGLVFECGRYLTAFCGVYAVEVLDVKRNHGETFALVRGGSHHFRLPSSWQHNHPFEVAARDRWPYPFERPEVSGPITVTGQLCTPKDVLARKVPVERVRVGDLLVFQQASAYGWAISHHDFLSHPHPELIYLEMG